MLKYENRMIQNLADRQQDILRHLLAKRDGLTVDELEELIGVTRTAVVQHLASLEQAGYVSKTGVRSTGGRPVRVFTLTAQGIDLFPKQYSWFAGLLMGAITAQMGEEGSARLLESLAGTIAANFEPRLRGLDDKARAAEVVRIMNELSFDAKLIDAKSGKTEISAANCIYHHLAAQYPQVCGFDIALLAALTGKNVTQNECIVRGGTVCRFGLTKPTNKGIDHERNRNPGSRT